MKKIYYL